MTSLEPWKMTKCGLLFKCLREKMKFILFKKSNDQKFISKNIKVPGKKITFGRN